MLNRWVFVMLIRGLLKAFVSYESRYFKIMTLVWLKCFISTHQIQNKGFMSRIWSLYSMNYVQNSIFLGLRGAWRVCAKNLTQINWFWQNGSLKYILHLVWKLCKKVGECDGFWKMEILGSDFDLKYDQTLASGPSLSNHLRTKLHLWSKSSTIVEFTVKFIW